MSGRLSAVAGIGGGGHSGLSDVTAGHWDSGAGGSLEAEWRLSALPHGAGFGLGAGGGFRRETAPCDAGRVGLPDPPEMTMRQRFSARYQGIRVSFGYPACPDLEDQAKLFRLIRPERIGVKLTEGFMMEPEASVSAMVFSHPEARYFNAV